MTSKARLTYASFNDIVQSIDKDSFVDDDSRFKASLVARSLCNRLESPYETFLRRTWCEPALTAALKIGIDIGMFDVLLRNEAQPTSTNVIARETGVSEALIDRVCKHLAAMNAIHEVGPGLYASTDYSNSLTNRGMQAGVNQQFIGFVSALRALPQWLKTHAFEIPSETQDTPWKKGIGTDKTFFEWLGANPDNSVDFNALMVGLESQWKSPMELYPVENRILQDFKGGVLIVDIGGGLGHDLKRFRQKFQVSSARYVLQDLEHVLFEAQVEEPIEKITQDFFTTQSIKGMPLIPPKLATIVPPGARLYFLKQICHDWNDEKAIEILQNIKPAMEPQYSKLLIHDMVIPSKGAAPYSTAVDLTMMSLFGAKERSESEWQQLIARAGLRLESIWGGPGYRESLMEVVRTD